MIQTTLTIHQVYLVGKDGMVTMWKCSHTLTDLVPRVYKKKKKEGDGDDVNEDDEKAEKQSGILSLELFPVFY